MKGIILLFLLIGVAHGGNVKYKACEDKEMKGEIISLTVSDCDATPCIFKRGGNYTLGLTFKPSGSPKNLKSVIHGIIAGEPVPFPFSGSDVCSCTDCGIKCPLTANQQYTYTATLPILSIYPQIELLVEWEMEDLDAKDDVWCFELPVEIMGSVESPALPRSVEKLHW